MSPAQGFAIRCAAVAQKGDCVARCLRGSSPDHRGAGRGIGLRDRPCRAFEPCWCRDLAGVGNHLSGFQPGERPVLLRIVRGAASSPSRTRRTAPGSPGRLLG